MAQPKKTIVIIGATGNQGGSVAHTFLSLSTWNVRCITRNPSSDGAQALKSLGAEIVEGDLSDPTSLTKAFEGAHAIFLNTDFWTTYRSALASGDPEKMKNAAELAFATEVLHGKNAADAASNVSTLERLVYSALAPARKHSKGRKPAKHWDSKAAVVDHIMEKQPELAKKSSFIYLGGYTTNAFLTPHLNSATGIYEFILTLPPTARLPIIDATKSTGPFVRALVESEPAGTNLLAYDENSYLSLGETVKLWSRVMGEESVYKQVTREFMHEKLGVPEEVLEGPAFMEEFGYVGGVEGVIEPRDLRSSVETKSFERWLGEQEREKVVD